MQKYIITQTTQPATNQPSAWVQWMTPGGVSAIAAVVALSFTVGGTIWNNFHLNKKIKALAAKVAKDEEKEILDPKDLERVGQILAQLSILSGSDRVTLGVFHNGVIGKKGATYDKVAILSGYCNPGIIPLPELGSDVKAESLMKDFQPLWKDEQRKEIILHKDTAEPSCKLYLNRRDIHHLNNKILSTEYLEVGILSYHWCSTYGELPLPEEGSRAESDLKELENEIISIIQSNKDRQRILGK